jgi:hypothetical protein
MSGLGKAYLAIYNVAQLIGWSLALWQSIHALVDKGDSSAVYAAAGRTVRKYTNWSRSSVHLLSKITGLYCRSVRRFVAMRQVCARRQHCWRPFTRPLVCPLPSAPRNSVALQFQASVLRPSPQS